MPRIRCIKPEFPQDEKLGSVSRDARLLFVQLWTVVDDAGRTRAASRLLASLLYPYDEDAPALIDGWIAELERVEAIRRYRVDGETYLDIPNWLKHQKIDRPTHSKLPPYIESSRILASPREPSPPDLDLDLERDRDLEGKGNGKGSSFATADADAQPPAPPVLTFPTIGTPKSWALTHAQIASWTELYPGVDVLAQCRRARAWIDANPKKTASGMPKFLVRWLNKAANESRGSPVQESRRVVPDVEETRRRYLT